MSETTTPTPAATEAAAREAHAALTTGCAVVRRPGVATWEMAGEDRARFLNGLVTCAVQGLAPGSGAYGFVTSAKGRVLADLAVLAADDRFLLELPAEAAETAAEHLLKYRIADRVELQPLAGVAVLTVAGPRAGEVLSAVAGEAPPSDGWAHDVVALAGAEVRWLRRAVAPVPAWDLWLAEGDREAVIRALAAAGAAVPGEAVGRAAWDAARVAAGVPRFGADFDAGNLPQETGLEERAVSYDKGCYLGQEVVARIHYRGGVNKGLAGLELAPGAAAGPGAAIRHDGRGAGRLGTVAELPGRSAPVALAVLHRRAAEPGTVVEVEGAGTATVVALPLAGGA